MSRIVIPAGRGCTLKQLQLSDTGRYFRLVMRNRMHLNRFGEPIYRQYPTKNAVAKRILGFSKQGKICMGIWRKNVLIGSIQLRMDDPAPFAEVSYLIARKYQGRGFVARATKAILKYEKQRGLVLMYAYASTKNERSIRVLKRLGFEQRGVFDGGTAMWIMNLR